MGACSCGTSGSPFGYASCQDIAARAVGFGFQDLTNSDRTLNYQSGTITQLIWDGILYNNDATYRMDLLKNVKTVVDERADPDMETLDNIDYVIAEGQRYISFEIVGTPNKLKEYVDALRCGTKGFTMVSANNELVGKLVEDKVYPIPIEKGTLWTKIIPTTRITSQKLMVKFMVAESFDDADMGFIPASEIEADLLGTTPQVQVELDAVVVATATTITLSIYYTLNNTTVTSPYLGATLADFVLYNEDTAAAVTVAVTEPTDGSYVLTFVAQTTGDILTLSDKSGSKISFTTRTGLTAL